MNKSINTHQKPRVGISACLRGESVRWDGGHKFHQLIEDWLAPRLTFETLCPELAAGMPVPRPPLQRVQYAQGIAAEGRDDSNIIMTDAMIAGAEKLRQACESHSLQGFIFKSGSPSCGYGSSPLFNPQGEIIDSGNGFFSQAIARQWPNLPMVEEQWLNSETRCQRFLLAVLGKNKDREYTTWLLHKAAQVEIEDLFEKAGLKRA